MGESHKPKSRERSQNAIKYILYNCSYIKKKVKVAQSRPILWDTIDLHSPWTPPGQNTRAGSLSLLQETFPTQGLDPGLPHCRWILYQLSHKGSPRILEWVAYPFPSGSSQPRNGTRVSFRHCRRILYQLSYQGSTVVVVVVVLVMY